MEEIADATMQPAAPVPPPPPPSTHRRSRLRVREVSSRFMSPMVGSTPSAESQRSKSAQRRRRQQELEACSTDENLVPETARSLDSSNPFGAYPHSNKSSAHRKHLLRNKENDATGGGTELQQPTRIARVRPDTPTVAGADRDRIIPSRFRQSVHRSSSTNSNTINGVSAKATTAAAKLLQDATSTDPLINSSSPPNLAPEAAADTRWQHVARSFNNYDFNSSRPIPSPCSRSLVNFPQLNSENSWLSLRAGGDLTVASSPSKTSLKNQVSGLSLPPLKPGAAADARKGKKLFNHQEDVKHSLKLLYNYYLQWRFANAKSEVSMLTQKTESERQIYYLGSKISEMHEVVKNKHIELERLRRITTLSTIVESQMPYLDEWSTVAEDYSYSLLGVTDALLNLSVRLPIIGGAKVDMAELKETLDSAVKVIEMVAFRIQSFMLKAEETECLVSELARVMGGERAHIQECADSLLKAYASQVEECSLRGHLIQFLGRENCRSRQKQKILPNIPSLPIRQSNGP